MARTPGRPAKEVWSARARLCATSFPHIILSVTMPCFGHIEHMHRFWSIWCFLSSDVAEMVDQQNSWNSFVISTYPLYLAWNVGMLVVNVWILWLPIVVFGGACRGKGSFPGHRYLIEGLSSLIPVHGILHIVNGFLPGGAYLLVVSWCYLGVFPRHSDLEWRWDGFPTCVRNSRGSWVPAATSYRGRCLGPMLPVTWIGWFLSASGKPRACGGPGSLPR
jgi:hypothetical protein